MAENAHKGLIRKYELISFHYIFYRVGIKYTAQWHRI